MYEVLPPEPREYDPMGDGPFWPGPVEAEFPPDDPDLWDGAEYMPDDDELFPSSEPVTFVTSSVIIGPGPRQAHGKRKEPQMPTFDELSKLAYNVHAEERKLAQLEHDLYQLKLRLARAKDDLERETSLVSLAAYNEGKIDGKNEAMRKLQLDAVLAEAKSVQDLARAVADLEDNVTRLELQVGYQRAQARYSRNLFDAALAAARVASVPTVQLAATGEAA